MEICESNSRGYAASYYFNAMVFCVFLQIKLSLSHATLILREYNEHDWANIQVILSTSNYPVLT